MKSFFILISVGALFIKSAGFVLADEKTVTGSAMLSSNNETQEFDNRVSKLKKFLSAQNSPLEDYAEDFVYWADQYELDYRLVPSITGVESSFGKKIPINSFNAYGWNNGNYLFKSWPQSIEHVSNTLKNKYYQKGANNIEKIAKRYAPPSKNWAYNVKYFMNKIDPIPLRYEY
jgi:hypothetical protein